ncbi:MAG: hypothetical protein AAB471_02200 [Patescibacteria group bacterium]
METWTVSPPNITHTNKLFYDRFGDRKTIVTDKSGLAVIAIAPNGDVVTVFACHPNANDGAPMLVLWAMMPNQDPYRLVVVPLHK